MRIEKGLPELLAPAGDFECLLAAVKGGADAVYVGGRSFGARAYAKNFDIDELRAAVVYCHLHGVKLYVTVNTLLDDAELISAVEFAFELYRIGVDALIVADLGLIRELRRLLPEMELHASTQVSVHNSLGADEAYRLGCSRVVLARECSERDIAEITESCLAYTEVFLHGALCVCHSGQCLFSSLVGGRSGNRGECAQPCRLPYADGGYPLSLSDLSLASHVPSLIRAGVSSLKIEGRMKAPDYVYTVTSIYRRLLDEGRAATRYEIRALERAFSRGGFTDGYYTEKTESRAMLGVRSREDKEATKEARKEGAEATFLPTRVKIFAEAEIRRGEPSRLTLMTGDGRRAVALGDVADEAISRPLTQDEVKSRLAKMGNTFFELSVSDIELTLDGGVNLSPKAINELRREAVAHLEGVYSGGGEAELDKSLIGKGISEPLYVDKVWTTAVFYRPEEYFSLSSDSSQMIDLAFLPLWNTDFSGVDPERVGLMLPPVVMERELKEVRAMLTKAREAGVKYALAGNLGHLSLAREAGLVVIGDFRFNITNSCTGDVLTSLGVNNNLLSPELTPAAARAIGGSVVAMGRIPLMITERCFMRDACGCSGCSECSLVDRRGAMFPMMREYKHRTLIFNSALTYMGDRQDELRGIRGRHFIFSTESAGEITALIRAFTRGEKMPLSMPLRRMGRRVVKG